jgi:hypothetical protein
MGIYYLQEEIHHKMNTARANFFWHGPQLKKKTYGKMGADGYPKAS